jgi:hypothetical protein
VIDRVFGRAAPRQRFEEQGDAKKAKVLEAIAAYSYDDATTKCMHRMEIDPLKSKA